jgi:hypothetical protein
VSESDRSAAKLEPIFVSIESAMSVERDDEGGRLARGLARFQSSATRAERRRRFGLALRAAGRVAPVSLAALAPLLAFEKLRPSPVTALVLAAGAALALASITGTALWVGLRRAPALSGALLLDDFHATGGRVANALAFARLPKAERTPLMQLAIEDALGIVQRLDVRRAVPLPVPRESWLVLVLAGGLALLASLEVRTLRPIPPKPTPPPALMSVDDVALFRSVGEELARTKSDPVQQAAVARYNRLVEDIAQHRLDRHEVFRRLAEIERDLGEHLEADREALEEGLDGVARELEKSPLSRKAAEALADKRLDDAEKALRELSEKLKSKKAPPTASELERLRSALKKASEETRERSTAIEARRRELAEERESLLKKKGESPSAAQKTQQKLAENERQLEHLDRQSNRAKRGGEQLSELDRELAKAAAELERAMKERRPGGGEAPEELERGAEDVQRMAQKKLDDAQKRELIQRLKEMREVLRQEGQGGEQRKERLQRFGQRAHGQRPGQGQGEGQQGSGQKGQGKLDVRLGRGNGSDGMPIPGGEAQGQATKDKGRGEGTGEGANGQPGEGFGNSHDGALAGERTHLEAKTHDVSAAGIDSGEGTASAEVIYGAAERGFVGKGYKDIFTEYQSVSEQVLEKDDIPPGYRFYVRRYFQLIRPRE